MTAGPLEPRPVVSPEPSLQFCARFLRVRIVIAGTHCSGKSTLIDDFVAGHPDYLHEPEPYEWLEDAYGEGVAVDLTTHDFYRQLEVSVERLQVYGVGSMVIAERSPVDFLAYILALADLGRCAKDCELIECAVELAAAGVANMDLLAVLPLNEMDGLFAPESEDLELREAMNDRLLDLITTDQYSLFGGGRTRIVEICGNRYERLQLLEEAACRFQ